MRGYQWWIWPALLVPASFVAIGMGGLVYTVIYWGKSARTPRGRGPEAARVGTLRSAARRRPEDFPYIPDCSEITSSPGTRLAYRLPLAQSPGWTLSGCWRPRLSGTARSRSSWSWPCGASCEALPTG